MQEVAGKEAFEKPGMEPRWTHSNKADVGSASSRFWFMILEGIVTEVYYPTVDRPQLRDLQYLVTDGKTFFHEEKRDLAVKMERIPTPPKQKGSRSGSRTATSDSCDPAILRAHGEEAFTLNWSSDKWKSVPDTKSIRTALRIDYVDLTHVITSPGTCIRFTFSGLTVTAGRGETTQ